MVRAALAALLLVTAPATVIAQPPGAPHPTAALTWLTGRWEGVGTMFLERSAAHLEVRPILGGRFIELSYGAGGMRGDAFEGRAIYQPLGGDRWEGTWFDSRGARFPIAANLSGQTLTADWGSAETERGRTVYALAEDGRLQIVDSVRLPDGRYREFARHSLTRAQ